MNSANRPFSSGSRQAPDPYDQYLEREGYYRKHVARDSTCLFRVFSEQVFDVQLYHEKVRQDCVRWMRMKSDVYAKKITGDIDDYLDEMSKPRSYGSFVELHALAHVYRRNVLLFEPYNLGTWFVNEDAYEDTVMIFFSPDKHFDSIFPTPFIQHAAYCQALVYEILYVKVFKLPDVMYSVERMLHDPDGKTMNVVKTWDKTEQVMDDGVVTSEGRQFIFNTAEETECVLDNYLLCHFHNKDNFAAVVDTYNKKNVNDLKEIRNIRTNGNKGPFARELILVNPMLCDKKISCVRQLLKEGITPFPYKVAKALDPNIYRNIEFDSWSDVRRELKYRNLYFEGNSLQVGAKCMVRLNESDERSLYCYIQEMKPDNGPCIVYVEDIAECRTVPYERLHPLPLDQTRSWAIPYKFRRPSGIQHVKITCTHHSRKKINFKEIDADVTKIKSSDNVIHEYYTPYYEPEKSLCCTLKNLTSLNNFHSAHMEMVVMPFTVGGGKQKLIQLKSDPVDTSERSNINANQADEENTYSSSGVYDMSSASSMSYGNQPYCYAYSEPFPYDSLTQATFCTHPYSAQQFSFAPQRPYTGSFYGAPFPMMTPIGDGFTGHQASNDDVPNFQAHPSVVSNGSDLPLHDLITLRYFFNLGVEYFRNNQFRLEPPAATHSSSNPEISNTIDTGNDIRELVDDMKHGMNLNVPNTNEALNKPRGAFKASAQQNTKRKFSYGAKTPKKQTDSRTNRSKSNNPDTNASTFATTTGRIIGQSVSGSTAEDISPDASQSIPYHHASVMQPPQYPVRLPYYAVDPATGDMVAPQGTCYFPTYMVPPYGHGFIVPPSDVMLIHENSQPPLLRNPLEAQYPPMTFASPQIGSGYTVMEYPLSSPMNTCLNNGANIDNGNTDAAQ